MSEEKTKQPKQKAVALGYDIKEDQAPKVLAKGEGEIALQIIKIAKEHGVTIREDANLVEILSALELDEFIPLEAYATVAEILRYIYSKQKT
jgi:flagellar biosynthesis protein